MREYFCIKRTTITLGLLALSLSSACSAKTIYLNSRNTDVSWHTRVLGLFSVSGSCKATGKINFNESNPRYSQANVKINTNSIDTGHTNANRTLKGAEFFYSKKYPYITFKSSKVDVVNGKITSMLGTLTIRGIAKPAKLHIDQMQTTPYRRVNAHTVINRSQFGIKGYPTIVSDKVYIAIHLQENH